MGCRRAVFVCCVDRSGRWLCVLWALSGLLYSEHRARSRSRDTDAHTGNAPVRLSSYYMTGLGGLCPPQFGQVATGCRSIFVRWTTFAICAVWKRCSVTRRDRLPRFPCLRPATYKRGTPMGLMKLCWPSFRPVKPLLRHFARLGLLHGGHETPTQPGLLSMMT